MAGYITPMTARLPPQVLADLHEACKHDSLAVRTIDMLVAEITRVSEMIAAIDPACTQPVVAINTQFLPADRSPQEPLPRCKLTCSYGDFSPDPRFNCQRLCKRAVGHTGMHHCLLPRHPADPDRLLDNDGVWQPPRLGGTPYTQGDGDHTPFALSTSLLTPTMPDPMPTIVDGALRDIPALVPKEDSSARTGDPDASVFADACKSHDLAAQAPLPRCKLPCSYGDWNPDPWLNCQRPCKRAVGHRGRHHCLGRHPGFEPGQQLLSHDPNGLLPPPPRCVCPNVCHTVTTHWFMLCDDCLFRTPAGVCPCVFESQGECCRRWADPAWPPPPMQTDMITPDLSTDEIDDGDFDLVSQAEALWDLATDADTGSTSAPSLLPQPVGTPYTGLADDPSTAIDTTQPESTTSDLSPDEIEDVENDLLRIQEFLATICRTQLATTSLPEANFSLAVPPDTPDELVLIPNACRIAYTDSDATSQGRGTDPLPECHVCNSEHTLLAEDDANACPRYPAQMICSPCYRPERLAECSLAGPPCVTWTTARFIADDGTHDGAETHHGTRAVLSL